MNQAILRTRYIDLVKRTVGFQLWEDPGSPPETLGELSPSVQRLARVISRFLSLLRLRVLVKGTSWPLLAHSLLGKERLDNIQDAVETVLREGVQGDLIETGVWRGGACILMKAILDAHGAADRSVYVADSFRGLPRSNRADGFNASSWGYLAVSRNEVEENFRKYELLDSRVVFLEGWFKDTLPGVGSTRFSIIRLDGDLYESTMDALTTLYPRLESGGFCIIDDYALQGCKTAVDEFRLKHGIAEPLKSVDWTCIYWRKAA